MQVTLIRHGMTAGNARRRYIGRTDEPLSEEGVTQAKRVGQDPARREVYVTPLQRTRQTAAILFPNARQIVADGLREMDFGTFENKSAADMEYDSAYRAWVDGNCLAPCPGGEGWEEFSARVCAAFSGIVTEAGERGEDKVVLVVHGGTIMAVLAHFARPRREFYSYGVDNCQGYRCQAVLSNDAPVALTGLTLWNGVEKPL